MIVCFVICELVKTKWKALSPACGLADDLYGASIDKMDQFPRDFDLRVKNDGVCIGRGHFSIVRKEVLETREVVAAKELKLVNRDALIRELYILDALKDVPNIVKLIGLAGNETSPTICYSFHSPSNNPYGNMTLLDFRWWLKSVLQTLAEIHERGVIHRDLKLQNIITNLETRQVTIIDFGLAEFNTKTASSHGKVGCIRLKAPELAMNYPFYDCSSDMWSLGLACLDIIMGVQLNWEAKTVEELITLMIRYAGNEDWNKFAQEYNYAAMTNMTVKRDWFELAMPRNYELVNEDTLDLVNRMLTLDPTERISARESLEHAFFSE